MAIELPDPLAPIAVISIQRLYPHVDNITDWQTQQSVRLAWDRIHALEERLQAVLATQATIIAAFNELLTAVEAIEVLAEQAYAKTQQP